MEHDFLVEVEEVSAPLAAILSFSARREDSPTTLYGTPRLSSAAAMMSIDAPVAGPCPR